MSNFPRTIALLNQVDLGHSVREVSPHGISMLGYLRVLDGTTPTFTEWPAEITVEERRDIFSQFIQETAPYEQQVVGTERQNQALAIMGLIDECARVSREHGFHEEGARLQREYADAHGEQEVMSGDDVLLYVARQQGTEQALVNYLANRLMLIVSEVLEAHDDLRKGESLGSVWYEAKDGAQGDIQIGEFQKPCGPLSELVDVVIRVFDLLGELGLAQVFVKVFFEKFDHNEGRPFKHGKKF